MNTRTEKYSGIVTSGYLRSEGRFWDKSLGYNLNSWQFLFPVLISLTIVYIFITVTFFPTFILIFQSWLYYSNLYCTFVLLQPLLYKLMYLDEDQKPNITLSHWIYYIFIVKLTPSTKIMGAALKGPYNIGLNVSARISSWNVLYVPPKRNEVINASLKLSYRQGHLLSLKLLFNSVNSLLPLICLMWPCKWSRVLETERNYKKHFNTREQCSNNFSNGTGKDVDQLKHHI